jgi:hypothetical protein
LAPSYNNGAPPSLRPALVHGFDAFHP